MASDGKRLEALVAFVEKTLCPKGFVVTPNHKIFEDGIQLAEFDIEIKGKFGSTEMSWLIECRDRKETAPGAWIEQLAGRKNIYGYNKVTAVSTSGFSPSAISVAKKTGIELREVTEVTPEAFQGWLAVPFYTQITKVYTLTSADLCVESTEDRRLEDAIVKAMSTEGKNEGVLKHCNGGSVIAYNAFVKEFEARPALYTDVIANGPAKQVVITCDYPAEDDHYVIETEIGPAKINQIQFIGELSIIEEEVPLLSATEYRNVDSLQRISQIAEFAPVSLPVGDVSLGLHRMDATGETFVFLRHKPLKT